ncbi:MAG: phosphatidate cytidylyltransferase [Gammaproteobacteria bacterium]|nr:phosphatidate cytidylyltransferase [Gammaproteobacteria bacterium]
MFPAVSPGKTLEGTIAGILAAGAAGLFFATAAAEPFVLLGVEPGWLIGIALLIGAGGLAGDLAVSLLKREAGVKDTGSMLPGHGGVLDRLDAVLVTLPLGYAALQLAGAVSP